MTTRVPDDFGAPYPAHDPMATARELQVHGERVRLVEGGPSDGFPVVLLHGWGASAYNFRAIIGPLATAGFVVSRKTWPAPPVASSTDGATASRSSPT